ncbi:hypothetical protein BD779DRAFT_1628833 [Infundibulicybe gibba]|nr:hypothetical protein BD779DRAFT_1628833 [Infundibulicybe gibba]
MHQGSTIRQLAFNLPSGSFQPLDLSSAQCRLSQDSGRHSLKQDINHQRKPKILLNRSEFTVSEGSIKDFKPAIPNRMKALVHPQDPDCDGYPYLASPLEPVKSIGACHFPLDSQHPCIRSKTMSCPNCRCSSCLALVNSTIPSTEFSLPPPELMTANRAPTNSEVAYSRDIIASSENMVSVIQAAVDALEKRKAELLGLVRAHQAAISPLRSFPSEILAEIFTQFVTTAQIHWCTGSLPPVLMLMQVCSRWRRIILDTPRLWTKIRTGHPASMIDSWIIRSKGSPLYVEWDSSCPTPVLEALVPHSHCWEHIDLCLEPSSHSILACVRTHLHSLKSVNLFFGYPAKTVDFFEVAPQLTEITLMGISEPVIIKLPWEQLTVCTLCTFDHGEVALYVLQHAKNLRELHLDFSESEGPGESAMSGPGFHLCHPGLNTLTTDWGPNMILDIDFFSSVTLPALQTLEVCFGYPDADDADGLDIIDTAQAELAVMLADFFEQSCMYLSTLELTDIPFSPSALIECLVFSPSLVSLDIQFDSRWCAIDQSFLHRLNVNHPGYILPRLSSLSLRGLADMSIEGPLNALITSRRHIDPKHHEEVALLENLTLECESLQLKSQYPQFQQFVSEGLNITWKQS